MNKCDENIRQLIALYADGELSNDEIALVDEHVATCEECRVELKMYLEIANELNIEDINVPEEFHNDLMKRLEIMEPKIIINEPKNSSKKPGFYSRYSKYMNVAAMLVFVILLSVIGLTRGNQWEESSVTDSDSTTTAETTMNTSTESTTAKSYESDMEMDESVLAEPAMMDVAMEEVESEEKATNKTRNSDNLTDISLDNNNGVKSDSEEAASIEMETEVSDADSANLDESEDSVVYIEEETVEEVTDAGMEDETAFTVADDQSVEIIETVTEETVTEKIDENTSVSSVETTTGFTDNSDEKEDAKSEIAIDSSGAENIEGNTSDTADEYGAGEAELKADDDVNMTLTSEGNTKIVNTPLIIIVTALIISIIGTFLMFFLRRTK